MADKKTPVKAIFSIKKRPVSKPLPVIAGSINQAAKYADFETVPPNLLDNWPGPLTIILPAIYPLPEGVVNSKNKIAIRVTKDPMSAKLASSLDTLLIATSANLTGMQPPEMRKKIDTALLHNCKEANLPWGIIENEKATPGNLPSTIVEPERVSGKWKIHIIRQGAVPYNNLIDPEWEIV